MKTNKTQEKISKDFGNAIRKLGEDKIKEKSSCCGAPIKVVGGHPDFVGDKERSCTLHYECDLCGKATDVQPIQNDTQPIQWEEEFDKRFNKFRECNPPHCHNLKWNGDLKELYDFISTLLSEQEQKIKKSLREKIENMAMVNDNEDRKNGFDIMKEDYEINTKDYDVKKSLAKLEALENGGVDNWEWYGEALNKWFDTWN